LEALDRTRPSLDFDKSLNLPRQTYVASRKWHYLSLRISETLIPIHLLFQEPLCCDLTHTSGPNSQLVSTSHLKCFYLSGQLVYFSRFAPHQSSQTRVIERPSLPKDWTNLLSASKGKQILINQKPLPNRPSHRFHSTTFTSITKHTTWDLLPILSPNTPIRHPSSQAILCQDTIRYQINRQPLRLTDTSTLLEEYQQRTKHATS